MNHDTVTLKICLFFKSTEIIPKLGVRFMLFNATFNNI